MSGMTLHHFVATSRWSNETLLPTVRERVATWFWAEGDLYRIVDDRGPPRTGGTWWVWRACTADSWASRTSA